MVPWLRSPEGDGAVVARAKYPKRVTGRRETQARVVEAGAQPKIRLRVSAQRRRPSGRRMRVSPLDESENRRGAPRCYKERGTSRDRCATVGRGCAPKDRAAFDRADMRRFTVLAGAEFSAKQIQRYAYFKRKSLKCIFAGVRQEDVKLRFVACRRRGGAAQAMRSSVPHLRAALNEQLVSRGLLGPRGSHAARRRQPCTVQYTTQPCTAKCQLTVVSASSRSLYMPVVRLKTCPALGRCSCGCRAGHPCPGFQPVVGLLVYVCTTPTSCASLCKCEFVRRTHPCEGGGRAWYDRYWSVQYPTLLRTYSTSSAVLFRRLLT